MNAPVDRQGFVRSNLHVLAAVVLTIAALFGCGLLFFGSLLPHANARNLIAAQVVGAEQSLADTQSVQAQTPDRLRAQIAAAQAALAPAYDALLTDLQAGMILNGLYQYAGATGVTITHLQNQTASAPGDRPAYRIITVRLQAQGAARNLIDFVTRIREAASKSFVFNAINVIVTNERSNVLLLDITLYTSPNATGKGLAQDTPPIPIPPPATSVEQQLTQQLDNAWKVENWPEVLRVLDQIKTINPNYPNLTEKMYAAHVNYGYRLLAAGKVEDARAEFNRALAIKPNGGEAYQALALTNTPTPIPSGQIIYVVNPGDTLFSIARRHGVTLTALKAANGLTDNIIHVGRKLIIPRP